MALASRNGVIVSAGNVRVTLEEGNAISIEPFSSQKIVTLPQSA